MADRPVDVEPMGENIAGEAPAEEPAAVTDGATVHDDDVELERTIGMPADQVADRFLGPVLVVQRDPSGDDTDE